MISFIIQILSCIFIGVCFFFLAKRYTKNKVLYFLLGFSICFSIRILYLFLLGFYKEFKIDYLFSYHQHYSILLSICVSYFIFLFLKRRLKKQDNTFVNIDSIGKKVAAK